MQVICTLNTTSKVVLSFNDIMDGMSSLIVNFHKLSGEQQKRVLDMIDVIRNTALFNSALDACEKCSHHACEQCIFNPLVKDTIRMY